MMVKRDSADGQCTTQITMRMPAKLEQDVIKIPAKSCRVSITPGLNAPRSKSTNNVPQATAFLDRSHRLSHFGGLLPLNLAVASEVR